MRSNQLPETIFRLCIGIALGSSLAFMIFTGGGGTEVVFAYKDVEHPISSGFALGFVASLPIGILYFFWRRLRNARALRKGQPEPPYPHYIGRPAIGVACVLVLLLLWWADRALA